MSPGQAGERLGRRRLPQRLPPTPGLAVLPGPSHTRKVLKVRPHHAENQDMSDLSRLLDDVYRTTPAASALDEVFANWIPGPAPAVVEPEPEVEVVEEPVAVEVVPALEPRVPSRGLVWSITDDDILPAKPGRRRLFLRRR